MKKLLLILSVVIAGCGGGGDSTPAIITPNSTVDPQQAAEIFQIQSSISIQTNVTEILLTGPLFESTPILLPNLKAKYDSLCGSVVAVQNAIPIDLNYDGKKDLVFNLWCRHAGELYYGPTVNSLVALIQLPDGSFVDKTKEIFGSDMVDIGGVGYGYATEDFNGDGYNDIIFAVSREDGRANEGGKSNNMMAETVSLMSDGKGYYSQIKFGLPKWGGDVRLTKDSNGKNMVIVISSGYSKPEVWSFDGKWNQVTSYDWLEPNYVIMGSTIINKFSNGAKLEIWNLINGIWSRITEYSYLSTKTKNITITPRVGLPYNENIFTLDNNDYLDMGGLYEGCSLKRTRNGPKEVIYSFLGRLIPGRYTGQTVTTGYSTDYNSGFPTLKLIALGVTEQSKSFNPVTLATIELDGNHYHMECEDLNGDGLDDIIIRNTGFYPVIFINDGNGNFKKIDSKFLPKKPYSSSEIYVDIDGDGVKDLLYFPIGEYNPDGINQYDATFNGDKTTTVQFKLYKGKRNVRSEEL